MSAYLITQATGIQALATITFLVESGASVHAVVRDPQKELPSILKHPNVTIFKGDSTDFESIFNAAQGCKAAYLNTFPLPGIETQQAKTICEAAKKAGVKSIVACTTFHTSKRELWDIEDTKKTGLYYYFISKSEVENTVRSAGFDTYTILRPGFIHSDYMKPHVLMNFPELTTEATLYHLYDEDNCMPHTAVKDIGNYAAAALQDPTKFGGAEIELGYELLTVKESRDILAKVSGKDVKLRRIPEEEREEALKAVNARGFHTWASAVDLRVSKDVGIATQEKYGISFTSLEQTLQKEKSRLLEAIQG